MWCISLRIPARNDAKTLKIRMFCSAYKPAIANTIQQHRIQPAGGRNSTIQQMEWAQQFAMDVEYSQDVVFDWGNLLLLLNEGTFKLIQ